MDAETAPLEKRRLGRTDLEVTALGFGAWEIGWTPVDDGDEVGRLLNEALDLGINFVDSSAAYRWSEELIAKYIGHRRDEFIYATKCGSWRVQQPDGEWVQTLDYSAKAIAPQIDRSLQRMGTDCIDIMQLHSPSLEDLQKGDGVEGLKRAQEQGKVRFISLSADDEAAQYAVQMGDFDTLQLSYNALLTEPKGVIEAARANDMGIIVKNPIANAIYEKARPAGGGDAELWDRAQRRLAPAAIGDLSRVEATLRWLLADSDVHTAIVGTTNIDHLRQNVEAARRGALSPEVVAAMAG
jgi:aryl-alcohol dehydrogenase-like predicted oxidoreductase